MRSTTPTRFSCETPRSSRSWSYSFGRTGLRRLPQCLTVSPDREFNTGGLMARTPLAGAVEEAAAKIADEHTRTTRRRFLKGAGATVVGASLLGRLAEPGSAKGAPPPGARIVVVGAGLAGLTCAHRLQQAGYAAQIYEASDRIAGRCYTGRGELAHGQNYYPGGEP